MKKVYRIEHKKHKIGPYNVSTRSDWGVYEMADEHRANRSAHLPPRLDGIEVVSANMRFGCPSKTKLKKWFGKKWINIIMGTEEFCIKEYVVAIRIDSISKLQCAFYKEYVIEEKDISHLFI